MTLQLLHSEFPYTVYEENFILFFISEGTDALLLSFLVQYSGRAQDI
jgi:hypothetical protein